MILLNYSHPLTDEHLAQVEQATGQKINQMYTIPVQFDPQQPFSEQIQAILSQVPLSPQDFQTLPILVNLPSLNVIAALLLAELHGRMGYFPPILRLRQVEDSLPPRFEVAEILNLQTVREQARQKR
jgi:hypothetical protein